MTVAGVVLAGGNGRRLGGTDKSEIRVEGRRTLDLAKEALGALPTTVVGPEHRGGPAAALIAALRAMPTPPEAVVVLAVDMPHVTARTVARLLGVDLDGYDGAVLDDGRPQYLCALYRVQPLLAGAPHEPDGLSMRRLVEALRLAPVPAHGDEGHDLDTPADLARSRATPPWSEG